MTLTKQENVEYEIVMATNNMKNVIPTLLAYTDIRGNDCWIIRQAIEILEKVKYNFKED